MFNIIWFEVIYEMFHILNCGFEIKWAMIIAVTKAIAFITAMIIAHLIIWFDGTTVWYQLDKNRWRWWLQKIGLSNFVYLYD